MLAAGRLGRGVPGGVAGADGHAAAAEAARVLRPGRRGRADPARPDPGRLGAPLHPAPQRSGEVEARPPAAQERAGQDPRRAAVPGAAHAGRGGRRRVLRRRTPTSCAGRWGPSAPPSGWSGCAAGSTRAWRPTGSSGELADKIFDRMLAFANFGFPESHSISFASLVYYSAWFKLYHPAAFCAALLNAQPMGFYSPQSLVADARRHGVRGARPGRQPRAGPEADAAAGRAQRGRAGGPAGAGRDPQRSGWKLAEQIDAERARDGPYRDLADLAAPRPAHRRRRPRRWPRPGRSGRSGWTGGRRCGRRGWSPRCGRSSCRAPPSASTPRRCRG